MPAKSNNKSKFLMYKGKPLVRCEDTLYYGNIYDKYVAKLQIKSKKKLCNLDVADKVSIQIIDTDPNVDIKKKIIKKGEKDGLYIALDLADTWLSRASNEGTKHNDDL